MVFRDPLLDGQFLRTMAHATYGGAEIGECLAAAALVRENDRESWLRAWSALGDRVLAIGEQSASRGHAVSARHAYLRAANYYRNAYILHLEAPLPSAVTTAYRQQRDAFAKAQVGTAFAIPFAGVSLHGYFFSAGEAQRPLVISVGGYDSTAEEGYFFNAVAALERGYHCVTFDGPGQGAALIESGLTFRPDWEKVIAAVIDEVVARPDVADVVIIGESFGGYLAPRAAARDPRVKACVLDPAQLNLFRAALSRIPLPASLKADLPRGPLWVVALLQWVMARMAKKLTKGWALRRGMLTHGVATPWDYIVETTRYAQEKLVAEIACPTLVCDPADDDISAFARDFYDKLTCPKQYLRFTADDGAADHCVMGNRGLYHQRVFDWLDTRLAR